MKLSQFALIALSLVATGELKAQQPPAPAPQPGVPAQDQGLKIRPLAFQIAEPPTEVYAHDPTAQPGTPGAKLEVKGYLNHEFSLLPFKGKNLICTKSSDAASAKDEANILAKIVLPDNFKNGIFMFLPGTGAPKAPLYRVLVIDDSVRAFPRGSIRVMNLSRSNVRIQLEKETFDFKSGEMRNIEDPPTDDTQNSGMRAFSQVGNQWQKITTQVWPSPGQKRVIQVLFDNPATKQIDLTGIRDVAVEY